jgi:hypothetical protein
MALCFKHLSVLIGCKTKNAGEKRGVPDGWVKRAPGFYVSASSGATAILVRQAVSADTSK